MAWGIDGKARGSGYYLYLVDPLRAKWEIKESSSVYISTKKQGFIKKLKTMIVRLFSKLK